MIAWLKRWRKARDERLCSEGKHRWLLLPRWPIEKFGTGLQSAVNISSAAFYSWYRCERCGVFAKAVRL